MYFQTFPERFSIQLSRLDLNVIFLIDSCPKRNNYLVKIKTERSHNHNINLVLDHLSIHITKQEAHSKHSKINDLAISLNFGQHVFQNDFKYFDLYLAF